MLLCDRSLLRRIMSILYLFGPLKSRELLNFPPNYEFKLSFHLGHSDSDARYFAA